MTRSKAPIHHRRPNPTRRFAVLAAGFAFSLSAPASARTFEDWCLGYYEASPAARRTIENIWTQTAQQERLGDATPTLTWRDPPREKPADMATFAAHCARLAAVGAEHPVALSFFYGMSSGADCDFAPIEGTPWVHGVSASCQDAGLTAPETPPVLVPQGESGDGFATGVGCGAFKPGTSDRGLVAAISRSPQVTALSLNYCKTTELAAIGRLSNLHELELSHTGVADVRALTALVGLRKLDLSTNDIRDVSPLMSLINLVALDLSENAQLTDIWAIRYMVNLTDLNLLKASIVDVSPLAGLTWIRSLDLSGNQIVDVRPITSLKHVTRLLLYRNQIRDVAPLKSMDSLKQHGSQTQLEGNPASAEDVQDLVNAGIVMYTF